MGNLKKGTAEYREYEDSSEFIIHEMNFYSWEDFLIRAKNLKALYLTSNILIKQLYLWYLYSRDMSMDRKNRAWAYVNGRLGFKKLTKL